MLTLEPLSQTSAGVAVFSLLKMVYYIGMELREIFKFFKKYKIRLVFSGLMFGLFGVLAYFLLPPKYVATGTFFVKRSVVPPTAEHFTYEGYYSQQTALSYTKTVVGLFESSDMKSAALEKLGVSVNEEALRRFSRKVRVKNAGPQLITLQIKGDSVEEVGGFWGALTSVTLEKASELNQTGDPFLQVEEVVEAPVVKQTYNNVWVNFVGGFGLGYVLRVFCLALKEYLKG